MPRCVANYLTVDPVTGAIGADFSGHVQAAGVDLIEGASNSPGRDRHIRWLRSADNSNASELFTWAAGLSEQIQMKLFATDGKTGFLAVDHQSDTGDIITWCGANGINRNLITGFGNSDFLVARNAAIIDTLGAWAVIPPPNSTSGGAFTINFDGTTALFCVTISQFASAVTDGMVTRHFIDGVACRDVGVNASAAANQHTEFVNWFKVTGLTAGTHYWWIQIIHGNSDGNDYANLLVLQ